MMNPPEEVVIFENRLTILGWTADSGVIVGWYGDSSDEASGSVFVLIKREAGFSGEPETEAADLEALYAFR